MPVLPRLKDSDVLLGAVRDGIGRLTWQSRSFAYAEKYDEQKKQYTGLQAGQATQVRSTNRLIIRAMRTTSCNPPGSTMAAKRSDPRHFLKRSYTTCQGPKRSGRPRSHQR